VLQKWQEGVVPQAIQGFIRLRAVCFTLVQAILQHPTANGFHVESIQHMRCKQVYQRKAKICEREDRGKICPNDLHSRNRARVFGNEHQFPRQWL
jgi:hypothetical protein